jgi:hypothetical protein
MDTGPVQGYGGIDPTAQTFNAVHRARADVNVDATLLTRYQPDDQESYSLAVARKNRSPNFYDFAYVRSNNWRDSASSCSRSPDRWTASRLDLRFDLLQLRITSRGQQIEECSLDAMQPLAGSLDREHRILKSRGAMLPGDARELAIVLCHGRTKFGGEIPVVNSIERRILERQ